MGILRAEVLPKKVKPGRYGDGGGLYLVVAPGGSRSWVQRLTVQGLRTDKGLGGYPVVSLAQARKVADANRVDVARGVDPWAGRVKAPRAARRGVPTFRHLALECHAQRTVTRLKNPRNATGWRQALERHAFPRLGDMPITEIKRQDVLDVLLPIWTEIPETARRIRQRIRIVFERAMAHGLIDFNPAGEAINGALDPMPKLVNGHHKALPWRDVPVAIKTIRWSEARPVTRLCFEFLILTAARSAEARGATWEEIDLQASVWTIPPSRMKMGRPHRVPLSIQAQGILREAKERLSRPLERASGLVFPTPTGQALGLNVLSIRANKESLGGSVHGFRSSFRDFCAENGYPREVAELALAHNVGNQVEMAYYRTDLLDQRRVVMQAWSDHCDPLPF